MTAKELAQAAGSLAFLKDCFEIDRKLHDDGRITDTMIKALDKSLHIVTEAMLESLRNEVHENIDCEFAKLEGVSKL